MRRIAGAILLVAASVCWVGAELGRTHAEWLYGPGVILAIMGLFQIVRRRADDKSS